MSFMEIHILIEDRDPLNVCCEGLLGADRSWYESRHKILPYNSSS
jgi:hypothetical protein